MSKIFDESVSALIQPLLPVRALFNLFVNNGRKRRVLRPTNRPVPPLPQGRSPILLVREADYQIWGMIHTMYDNMTRRVCSPVPIITGRSCYKTRGCQPITGYRLVSLYLTKVTAPPSAAPQRLTALIYVLYEYLRANLQFS